MTKFTTIHKNMLNVSTAVSNSNKNEMCTHLIRKCSTDPSICFPFLQCYKVPIMTLLKVLKKGRIS